MGYGLVVFATDFQQGHRLKQLLVIVAAQFLALIKSLMRGFQAGHILLAAKNGMGLQFGCFAAQA